MIEIAEVDLVRIEWIRSFGNEFVWWESAMVVQTSLRNLRNRWALFRNYCKNEDMERLYEWVLNEMKY